MSVQVTVRTADADDVADLQRIYRQASLSNPGDREALLANPEHLVFAGSGVHDGRTRVAIANGQLVGFASTVAGESGQLELEDLFVDPSWQRRGVARHLVADVAQTAHVNGIRTVVVTGNPHARAFYLSVGFIEFDEAFTEFGPASRFRLDLS